MGESGADHDDVLVMSARNGVESGTRMYNTVARQGDTLTLSVAQGADSSDDGAITISANHSLARVRSRPRICSALPSTGPGAALDAMGMKTCYYQGNYGQHGTELLHVSWGALRVIPGAAELHGATDGLNGLKLCGDPCVPAGERSFAAFGELLPPDRRSECVAGACGCQFHCACFRSDELAPRGNVTILGAMAAVFRTGEPGYQSPADNPAKLIFYRTSAVTTVPAELRQVARAPSEADGAVHMLLVRADCKGSTRFSPIALVHELRLD